VTSRDWQSTEISLSQIGHGATGPGSPPAAGHFALIFQNYDNYFNILTNEGE
jgi:hypothetical protein